MKTSNELKSTEKKYEYEILWFFVFLTSFISIGAIFGLYNVVMGKVLAATYISSKWLSICIYGLIYKHTLLMMLMKFSKNNQFLIYKFFQIFSAIVFFLIGGIGAGPGAHRFFTHHAYKATRGLKIFLIFAQQISGMVCKSLNKFYRYLKINF